MAFKIRIGNVTRVVEAEPKAAPASQAEETMVVRLRVIQPQAPPRLVVPPPYPRPTAGAALKQATVIDHLADGTPYIRSYVEGSGSTGPGDDRYETARASVTIFCSRKLGFQIALVACHHYCAAPCVDHVDAVVLHGWRSVVPKPQYVMKTRKNDEDE